MSTSKSPSKTKTTAHAGKKKKKTAKKHAKGSSAPGGTSPGASNGHINWLRDWIAPISFKNLTSGQKQIKKDSYELYVRGTLQREDQNDGTGHSINLRWINDSSDSDLRYLAAFLNPDPEEVDDGNGNGNGGPGGNPLVPTPPPQPPPPTL